MSRPRRRPRSRRRAARQNWKRRLVVGGIAAVLGAAFVAVLLRRVGQPPAHQPFRFPTAAAAAVTPTAEIEAGERARLESLLHGLQRTPSHESDSHR